MGIGRSLGLLGAGYAWRGLGLDSAGRRLLAAVGGDDEQERMLGGIALVKGGERSVALIESALDAGAASPQAVRLLADIGGDRARSVLESAARTAGAVGEAAEDSLDLLDRIEESEGDP